MACAFHHSRSMRTSHSLAAVYGGHLSRAWTNAFKYSVHSAHGVYRSLRAPQKWAKSSSPTLHRSITRQALSPAARLETLQLSTVLDRVRKSIHIEQALTEQDEICMTGYGKHLGTSIAWSLRWRFDGAFREELKGSHISYKWGFNGGSGNCWEVDSSGVSRPMEYDDHESLLLSAWIRTGCWLSPAAAKYLVIQLVPTDEETGSLEAPPISDVWAEPPGSNHIAVGLRLKTGKMVARVRICRLTWQPVALSQPLCGDLELWKFVDWTMWPKAGIQYPKEVQHHAYAGGHHMYHTVSCCVFKPHLTVLSAFSMPVSPLLPDDTFFDDNADSAVEAWQSTSGHILVAASLNGKTPGYFILDTGASGFVIERASADELDLEMFGELHVAGVSGKVRTRFRRAQTLQLGPLTIREPVFMEMPIEGLVKGGPGNVIGIVGYDVFRRSVIEMPGQATRAQREAALQSDDLPLSAPPALPSPGIRSHPLAELVSVGASSAAHKGPLTTALEAKGGGAKDARAAAAGGGGGGKRYRLNVYNPLYYHKTQGAKHWDWHAINMISNLPHVEVKFEGQNGVTYRALFMVDSGAGGTDVMFHSRAVKELNLSQPNAKAKVRYVRGVGGDSLKTVKVQCGELPWAQLATTRFEQVECLYAAAGGLDISLYSAGIICANLLVRNSVIFDYARRRIGFKRDA